MGVLFYFGLVMASVLVTSAGLLAMAFCLVVSSSSGADCTDGDVVVVDQKAAYRDIRIGRLVPWSKSCGWCAHQPGANVVLFIGPASRALPQTALSLWRGAARLDGAVRPSYSTSPDSTPAPTNRRGGGGSWRAVRQP